MTTSNNVMQWNCLRRNKRKYLIELGIFHTTLCLTLRNTDKIRVVFDAAANNKGQRLNSSLCTGPDFLNCLIGVLLRFRNNNITMGADIEAI